MEPFNLWAYIEPLMPILAPAVMALVGLTITVWIDSYIRFVYKSTLQGIILLVLILIAQNITEFYLANGEPMILLRTIIAIFGYVIRPAILMFFIIIVDPDHGHALAWVLFGLNVLVHASALFSDICFKITEENHYVGGQLANTCLYVSLLLMANLLFVSIRRYVKVRKREVILPIFIILMLLASIYQDLVLGGNKPPIDYLTQAVTLSCIFFYMWLHLQFVREHENALMADQRIRIMLSQIQPHFMFNSLGAIEELCDSDPAMAKNATVLFSRYLRGNLGSLSEEGLIPFEKELEHTQLYLELEKLRFQDALQVRYEITCTDFSLPTLTLEPLAENAVRHGVRGNPDGRGTVTIRTEELPKYYVISVTDDGPGFDPNNLPEGEEHIGISNVRSRLQRICQGVLEIRSAPGEGAKAVILLSKNKIKEKKRKRKKEKEREQE